MRCVKAERRVIEIIDGQLDDESAHVPQSASSLTEDDKAAIVLASDGLWKVVSSDDF